MENQVTASPEEPCEWIRSAPGEVIPARFSARTETAGLNVTIMAEVRDHGPEAVCITIAQAGPAHGAPVTQKALRKIAVEQIIRSAIGQLSRQSESDPSAPPDRLGVVARIYLDALAAGRAPVNAVAAGLPCARSTAGRLVGEARQAGLLSATTPGRPSALRASPYASWREEHRCAVVVETVAAPVLGEGVVVQAERGQARAGARSSARLTEVGRPACWWANQVQPGGLLLLTPLSLGLPAGVG